MKDERENMENNTSNQLIGLGIALAAMGYISTLSPQTQRKLIIGVESGLKKINDSQDSEEINHKNSISTGEQK